MTYDTQGRRVLQGHPSRWEDECKALWIAATNALHKLEQSRFSNSEHEQAKDILRKATTAPHTAPRVQRLREIVDKPRQIIEDHDNNQLIKEENMMTDTQSQIVIAMRRANRAMTQAEIAKATGLDAGHVLSDVLALGAMGYIRKAGSFYALVRSRW